MEPFNENNPLEKLKVCCDADPTVRVSWGDIRAELGWSASTLRRARRAAELHPKHSTKVANVFGVLRDWVVNPLGPPIQPDGRPWRPRFTVWLSGRNRMTIEELAYGPAFQIVSRELKREQADRIPGVAMYGVLKLARELDPEGLNAAYLAVKEPDDATPTIRQ